VEYSKNRITRYYGYKIENLDLDNLLFIIDEINVKENPKIWEEGNIIFYQYPGQPLIIIKDGMFYADEKVWEGKEFSHRQIRHQASILLRILGKFGFARFNRKAVPRRKFTPYKWRKKYLKPFVKRHYYEI